MITVERLEEIRQRFTLTNKDGDKYPQETDDLVSLAKLALTPPQDVAGLIEDLRGAEWICDDERLPFSKEVCRKAAAALLSLSARNRELEAENADMKISVIAFAGPFAAEHAKLWGLPKNHLFPTHYDILEKCGARMVDFVRADEAAIRAANLQGNGGEHE